MAPEDRPVMRDSNETLWQLVADQNGLLTSLDLSPDFKVRLPNEPTLRNMSLPRTSHSREYFSTAATVDASSRYASLRVSVPPIDENECPRQERHNTPPTVLPVPHHINRSTQTSQTFSPPREPREPRERAALEDLQLNILREELRREEHKLHAACVESAAKGSAVRAFASLELARYRHKRIWVL